MKLLIYSHTFAPHVGGVETFSMSLAQGLVDPGSKENLVTVVTNTAAPGPEQSPGPSFKVTRRPTAWALWRLIGCADKVVLAGPAILPLFFALVRRKPVIVTHHGYQSICPNGLLFHLPTQRSCPGHFAAGRYFECFKCNTRHQGAVGSTRSLLLTFLRRWLCWFANSNVAVSGHVSRRVALPRAEVICNGVPKLPRRKVGFEASRSLVCFAYVGRLVTEKGVATLLDAARLLKARKCRFRVKIIGDGPEREALQKLASSASLREEVSFEGFHTGSALHEALTGVSAIVMPSIWEEAGPLSPLEQMMQGRLVIGSDLGGLAEEIGDVGLRFDAGSSAALADRMQAVVEDPQSVTLLEGRARERALNLYSLDRMLQEYQTLLQRL